MLCQCCAMYLLDWSDHLEFASAMSINQHRYIPFKQNGQVGLLRLHLSVFNPALHISKSM
jgi:hypothetical protein